MRLSNDSRTTGSEQADRHDLAWVGRQDPWACPVGHLGQTNLRATCPLSCSGDGGAARGAARDSVGAPAAVRAAARQVPQGLYQLGRQCGHGSGILRVIQGPRPGGHGGDDVRRPARQVPAHAGGGCGGAGLEGRGGGALCAALRGGGGAAAPAGGAGAIGGRRGADGAVPGGADGRCGAGRDGRGARGAVVEPARRVRVRAHGGGLRQMDRDVGGESFGGDCAVPDEGRDGTRGGDLRVQGVQGPGQCRGGSPGQPGHVRGAVGYGGGGGG